MESGIIQQDAMDYIYAVFFLRQTNVDDKTDMLLVLIDPSFSRRSIVSIVHHP
jgi:hypothetical protein